MDILMVAAELHPFARATEAAEVVAALSKTLRQHGHEVTLALPRYPGFEAHGLLVARRLTPLVLPDGSSLTVLDGQLSSGVRLVLFDAGDLYQRPGVYGDGGAEYKDNPERFGVLCQAAAAFVCQRAEQGKPFDVVHLHDWPAALVPLALSRVMDLPVPTVLTVHDPRRQGVFPVSTFPALGLPKEVAGEAGLLLDGELNLLKGGILYSDVVTTASEGFVGALARDERLGALPRFLAERGVALVSVPNGIDYATFNPATDPALSTRYDAEDASRKGIVKTELVRRLELELETARPLAVAWGDAQHEAALAGVAAALPMLLENDVTVVIAGGTNPELVRSLGAATNRYPEVFAHLPEVDSAGVRRLLAAADIALVGDLETPAGTAALVASRYGAVPVARATGAIADLVVDCDARLETGTGFLYDEPTPAAFVGAVQRALAAYRGPRWEALRRRVMRQDLGWDRSARRFLQLYKQAIATKGN